MDRIARREFRDNMHDKKWNRERFHPFKRMTDAQKLTHETQVVGDRLMTVAVVSAEARGHFNQRLQPLERLENLAERQVSATLQRIGLGMPVPAGQLDALEKVRKNLSDKIDKIEKARDDAIARNLKVGIALYCQKHGLAQAAKVAKSMYWRMAALQGVEAANRALEKLFNDMLKAVVEGKLGIGSY